MATLTYREAAKRVHRTKRCVEYWRARGMEMTWDVRDGQRVRVVEEQVLLAWWRERMRNDPAHRYRIRARKAAQASAHDRSDPVPDPS